MTEVVVYISGELTPVWKLSALVPHDAKPYHRVVETIYDHDAQTMTLYIEQAPRPLELTQRQIDWLFEHVNWIAMSDWPWLCDLADRLEAAASNALK
jgi:hypothetical protein